MGDISHGIPHGTDTVPDYFGLLAGARTWRLANTMWARMGGWLWSWSMLDCWRKGEEWKEAECREGHRIPGDNCACGIWAFFDPETMQARLRTSHGPGEPYEYVSGIIGAGGDIVEHELGFRAQYAKVLGIFSDEWPTPKQEIAASYNCPIIAPDTYDAFCDKHGLIRLDLE
jgi:hypothetical protein